LPIVGVAILLLSIAVFASPYRLRRVQSFIDPNIDPLGASFQIRQITLALGSGGFFGRGLGNSQQKYAFIPEASSDSIFAIIAEEVGFVGSLILFLLFSYYIFLFYKLSARLMVGSFEQLLIAGLWLWVSGQTLLNLAAIVALVPLTGLTLPFFSQGGSSLVSLLFLNGIGYKLARSTK
jgi:cell division protein FtsW